MGNTFCHRERIQSANFGNWQPVAVLLHIQEREQRVNKNTKHRQFSITRRIMFSFPMKLRHLCVLGIRGMLLGSSCYHWGIMELLDWLHTLHRKQLFWPVRMTFGHAFGIGGHQPYRFIFMFPNVMIILSGVFL